MKNSKRFARPFTLSTLVFISIFPVSLTGCVGGRGGGGGIGSPLIQMVAYAAVKGTEGPRFSEMEQGMTPIRPARGRLVLFSNKPSFPAVPKITSYHCLFDELPFSNTSETFIYTDLNPGSYTLVEMDMDRKNLKNKIWKPRPGAIPASFSVATNQVTYVVAELDSEKNLIFHEIHKEEITPALAELRHHFKNIQPYEEQPDYVGPKGGKE